MFQRSRRAAAPEWEARFISQHTGVTSLGLNPTLGGYSGANDSLALGEDIPASSTARIWVGGACPNPQDSEYGGMHGETSGSRTTCMFRG